MSSVLFFCMVILGLMILPYSIRFAIALWSSIFQLYTLSVYSFYPSMTLLSCVSLGPKLLAFRRTFLQLPMLLLLTLIFTQIVSLAWSVDRHFGFTTILYEIPFVILYTVAFNLTQQELERTMLYLKSYAILSLFPLFFVVIFALNPHLNLLYVQSSLAKLFVHHFPLTWYLKSYSAVEWEGKPRGIIFDPNAGGGYLGICALVFYGLGIYCQKTWLKIVGTLHWFGIFFSSVVAAMCLAFFIPFLFASIYFYVQRKIFFGISFRVFLFYLFALFFGIAFTLLILSPHIREFFILKANSRVELWHLALNAISAHPLKGLGFGGLEHIYVHYYLPQNDNPQYRPHNTLLALWAQSGFIAMLLGLGFIVSVLVSCYRAFFEAPNERERLFILFMSGAITWMFLHSMGENWGIVSEIHVQPLIATVYGLMMGLALRKKNSLSNIDH